MGDWWIDESLPVGPGEYDEEAALKNLGHSMASLGAAMNRAWGGSTLLHSTLGEYEHVWVGETRIGPSIYPDTMLTPEVQSNTGPRPKRAFGRNGKKRY